MRYSAVDLLSEPCAGDCATLAKPLAPEEVRVGDFVATLHVVYEMPSFFWCAESYQIAPDEPVRLQLLPEDGGVPLKVRAVCLPFVFVRGPKGDYRTLDVRKCRLARLDRKFAKTVWKANKKKSRHSSIFNLDNTL